MKLFVVETALFIGCVSYLVAAFNKTIRSFAWSLSILRVSLLALFISMLYFMIFISYSCFVQPFLGLVCYKSLCYSTPTDLQMSEIILLISRRIFWLRSAPVASIYQPLLLTSSHKFSGFKSALAPWLPFLHLEVCFGSWIWSDTTNSQGWFARYLESFKNILMCVTEISDNLPKFHTVMRVAMWKFKALVLWVARRWASIVTSYGHLSLLPYRSKMGMYCRESTHIPSGFVGLTEWYTSSSCDLGSFPHILCAWLWMRIDVAMGIIMPGVRIVRVMAVRIPQGSGTTCVLMAAQRSPIIVISIVMFFISHLSFVQLYLLY